VPLPPSGSVLLRVQDQCMTGEVFGSLRCDCKQQLDFSFEILHRAASAAWREGGVGGGSSSSSSSSSSGGRSGAAAEGSGAGSEVVGLIVYLQQEGRGIGIAAKVSAYALQEGYGEAAGAGEGESPSGGAAAMAAALDTVDANRALGLPDDQREYEVVGDILRDLSIAPGGAADSPLYLLSNNPRKAEALGVPAERRLACLVQPTSAAAALYLKTKAQRMGHDIPQQFWVSSGGGGAV
jgi:GTP cyclohydrolase II